MPLYHVNPSTHRANICRANPSSLRSTGCPYAGEPHFSSRSEAAAHGRRGEEQEAREGASLLPVAAKKEARPSPRYGSLEAARGALMDEEAYGALREASRLKRVAAYEEGQWTSLPLDGSVTAEELEEHHLAFVEKAGMAYEDEEYSTINGLLRGAQEEEAWTPYRRRYAGILTSLYGEHYGNISVELPQETLLVRGDALSSPSVAPRFEALVPGSILEDPSYQSFTAELPVAESFARGVKGGGWLTVVEVPQGQRVVPGNAREWEVILPPATRHEVLAVDREARVVYCRTLPQASPRGAVEGFAP